MSTTPWNHIRRLAAQLLLTASWIAVMALHAHGQPCLQSPEPPGGSCPPCPNCPTCTACPDEKTNPDLTCANATVKANVRSDINLCLACGNELRTHCETCFGSCPKPPAQCCPKTSCPPGQNLMNPGSPSCYCEDNKDICEKIGASRVQAVQKHSQVTWTNSEQAFATATSRGWVKMPANAGLLLSQSPCLFKAWHTCWKSFAEQQKFAPDHWAFTSYADTNLGGWYLDSCIMSALTATNGMTPRDIYNDGHLRVRADIANLDANCQPLQPWQEELIKKAGCNVATVQFVEWTSPVSLLWTPEAKIKEVESRSRFPLNPTQKGRWFIWRGSGITPLVVWDPDNTGAIREASQLFGTHTWGKSWKNGYEALATLDANKNDWLEGDELKNMALWFDFNQDGVSDAGEVRTLNSVNVEAIGTKPSVQDEKNGHIFADQGFRRKLSSGLVTGRSVDWFSDVVDEQLDSSALGPPLPASGTAEARRFELQGAAPKDSVAGVWVWRALDPTGDELIENLPHGVLSLYSEQDTLNGHTIISAKLVPNSGKLREQVSMSRLEGKIRKQADGRIKLAYTSRTMHSGEVTTEAELSEDGTRILGITTEEVGPSKDPTKFLWIAQRAQPEATE